MDHAITRAAGATPRAVGEFQGFIDGEPSVGWADRKNMPQVGDKLFALPRQAAAPRSWAILLTSANHGTVGPLGSTFPHAGEKHERVQVMEIVEAGAPPAPDVDVAGLMHIGIDWSSDFIAEVRANALEEAAGLVDKATEGSLRSATAAAIRSLKGTCPVAAQAGQVAVPEGWTLVPTHPDQFMINAFITEYERPGGSECGCYRAMLAAAPSAPAVAQQAPAGKTCTCPSGDGSLRWPCPTHPPGAQASTPDVRSQEGGEA